jgi:hypothetical protein
MREELRRHSHFLKSLARLRFWPQPAAARAGSATLTIADNGGGSQSVSLKGTGVATLVS